MSGGSFGRSNKSCVSVIIVNRDENGLESTLLELQPIRSRADLEVIVVDSSRVSPDRTRPPFDSVTWIDYPRPSGNQRTIAQQRNVGLAACSGDVVIFLDANCVPEPCWFRAITEPILSGTERVVTGPTKSYSGKTIHDFFPHPKQAMEFATMNVAIHRSVFDEVGVFDEEIGFAEDVDLAWRIFERGISIWFEPQAAIRHDWGSWKDELRRAHRWGRGRIRLLLRHPSHWRRHPLHDLNFLAYSLVLLAVPVMVVAPWLFLVFLLPLARNARRRPFSMLAFNLAVGAGALHEFLDMTRRHVSRPQLSAL